jgi:hypothetical protein
VKDTEIDKMEIDAVDEDVREWRWRGICADTRDTERIERKSGIRLGVE